MKTAVIYWSGTGNTETMAEAVASKRAAKALAGNCAVLPYSFGCSSCKRRGLDCKRSSRRRRIGAVQGAWQEAGGIIFAFRIIFPDNLPK